MQIDEMHIVNFILALAALITAVAGIITAWRGHAVINSQLKPQIEKNGSDIQENTKVINNEIKPQLQTIRDIQNGKSDNAV